MKFLYLILLFFSSSAIAASYDESRVPEETNFQKLSEEMHTNKMGLVIMLHSEHCPFCHLMDKEILSPMVRSGEYDKRVFIRKLQIDVSDEVVDFKGRTVSASDLADEYDAQLTPTLIFLNHLGEQKAVKLIGINSLDFFEISVNQQIDELLQSINSEKSKKYS